MGLKSITKAVNVINLLADADTPMSLTEMSNELGIAKSTLHAIVATLLEEEYLAQDSDTNKYELGFRLFEIGSQFSRKLNISRIAMPYMQNLAKKTNETIHLAVLSDNEVLYVNKEESSVSIRIVTETGLKLPVHCTGVGKALISGHTTDELEKVAQEKGLKKYTDSTITDLKKLQKEISKVKGQGFAVDEQEFMVGLRCIAIPIYNHSGKVVCALSISGPVARMMGDSFEDKKKRLMHAAAKISQEMGYRE